MANHLLIYFAVLVLTCYYFFRRSRRRLYELAAKIPGPFDLPIIGSIHLGLGRGPEEITIYMMQFIHKMPSLMRAWIGPYLFLVVADPEQIFTILNSQDCVKRSYVYKFLRFGNALFNAEPDLWRKLRKQLNPAFSLAASRTFMPVFNEKADRLVESLNGSVGRENFDVLPVIGNFTLSTTTINTLGLDIDNEPGDYKERYLENAEKMFTIRWSRIYKPWLHLECIFKLTPAYREEQERLVVFQEMSRKMCEMRKKSQFENPNLDKTTERDDDNVRRPQRFIDHLEKMNLEQKNMMTNLDGIIFAGNDTTACMVSNTILMMAMHPEAQERAYQEVTGAIPHEYIDYGDLCKLDYLEMAIKESMRLLPVAPVVGRVCEKDIQLGEHTVPANTQLIIPIMKVHRDKQIWGERSDEFDPEHFSPENCAKRHPYAYLAFSGGIRNCIGMKYAIIAMKIVIAKLLKRYKFSTDLKLSELKPFVSIVMRLSNGYMVSIEQRTP